MRSKKRVAGLAIAVVVLATASEANAGFTQASCDPAYGAAVPSDFGANEFDRLYQDSTKYDWWENRIERVMVNGNVTMLKFEYTNFTTEYYFDKLSFLHLNGWLDLSGNLGTGETAWVYPLGGDVNNRRFYWKWLSDYSVTYQSNPRIHRTKVFCSAQAQPTAPHTPIVVNSRENGLLIADGDVIYTSVTQPAQTHMLLTVDVLNSDVTNPDTDLYASTTTTMPDNSNYTWRGYHSNPNNNYNAAGESLDLGYSGSSRTIYIGVRSYRGRSHFTLRADAQKVFAGRRTVTVCHPNVSNISQHSNWPKISETLRMASVRTRTLTHGNVYFSEFRMKYLNGTGGDHFCINDSSCDWCMTDTSFTDYCGYQGRWLGASTEKLRIPNAACTTSYNSSESLSVKLLHEIGHYLFRLTGPPYGEGFDGNEEYDGRPLYGHPFCRHSVMNGPYESSYRFCVYDDHCKGAGIPEPGFDCSANQNMWARIQNGNRAGWFYSFPAQGTGTQTAQIGKFAYRNYFSQQHVTFTFQ
jgi:hypothetical protein